MLQTLMIGLIATLIMAGATKSVASANEPMARANDAMASGIPIVVTLRLRNRPELDGLIMTQAQPKSPLFHHFISVAQFRAYFAPTMREYGATMKALEAAGFKVSRTSENRTAIYLIGSPIVVARTFHVLLAPIVEDSRIRYYALRGPTIPASLPFVQTVIGLEKAQGVVRPFMPSRHRGGRRVGAQSLSLGPDGGFGPAAITSGFDFPVTHGFDGSGVRIADVIDGVASDADIGTFLQRFRIRRTGPATKVVRVPTNGNAEQNDVQQADLDAEWMLAAAPGAALTDFYTSPFNQTTLLDAFTQVVSKDSIDVVNVSLGLCEASYPALALAVAPIIEQGAAEGITFESPQTGSNCRNPLGGEGKNYPIAFPMVPGDNAYGVAVGGSSILENSSLRVTNQAGWSGTGGGISVLFPTFAAQAAIEGVDAHGRNTPDFVLPAVVNGVGPSYYDPSLAWDGGIPFVNNAPAAGLLASYSEMTKSRLGAFNVTLYDLFSARGYGSVFTDIAAGCQTGSLNGAPICAKKGYDIVGGIGAFDGYKLGKLLK